MTSGQEPRGSREDQQETDSGRSVVEELHVVHGPGLGQVEDDEDEGCPDAGNPPNRLGPAAEVELALDKLIGADSDAEQDGDGIRGGETNDGDTGDGAEDSSRSESGQSQDDDDNNRQPDETERHLGALVENSPVRREGETAITSKGVKHAGVGSNRGNTAEETSKDDEENENASSGLSNAVEEDLGGSSEGAQAGFVVVLDTESQGKGQTETNADGGKDREKNTTRAVDIRLFSLLGHMGRTM